jgi:GNAT superfamily N-acetyltransferase
MKITSLGVRPILWQEFAEGMKDHWKGDPTHTPVFNNPWEIIQYPQEKWHTDIINIAFALEVNGEDVAYTSVHNISDSIIRTRGLYVKPEFRGNNFGFFLMEYSWHFFPETFTVAVEFFKEDVAPLMLNQGMSPVPYVPKLWSSYSNCYLKLLYWKRTKKRYLGYSGWEDSARFIKNNREDYSFGGKYNLNVDWTPEQWNEYFNTHRGSYEGKVSLKGLALLQ